MVTREETSDWVPNFLRSNKNRDPKFMPPPSYEVNVKSNGILEVMFSEDMKFPSELKRNLNDSAIFEIIYIQSNSSKEELRSFGLNRITLESWDIEQVKED